MPSNRSQMQREKLRREAQSRAQQIDSIVIPFGDQAIQLEIDFSKQYALLKTESQLADQMVQQGQTPIIIRGNQKLIPWRYLPYPYDRGGIILVEVIDVIPLRRSQAS